MTRQETINPFHEGELAAQARAGVGDVAQWAGGFIRDHLPAQHRAFHTAQPFLVAAGTGSGGHTWITLVDGPDGFITSPDARHLTLSTKLDATDPLAMTFENGGDIGFLGIELATRRRNRFSGHAVATQDGISVEIAQTFGNCPQYIHQRSWTRADKPQSIAAVESKSLNAAQTALIAGADTLFIGSGHHGRSDAASNGYDASHRGGAAGFVHVVSPTHLQIPDYAGNNFFNTIGNITANPRVGLLFVDFETGDLLHIAGRAHVDWAPQNAHDPDAWRMINVEIDAVLERPAAVGLRWSREDQKIRRLRLAKRVREADAITSFYFEPVDGGALAPFRAGQHLPIAAAIPGQRGRTKRSYSLSGSPANKAHYRLSIKREEKGIMSRFLHDHLREGDMIDTQEPMGDFVLPTNDCPVVLVSAGVGLTPMVSMLDAAARGDGTQPVWFIHGARNSRDHALRDEVSDLVSQHDRLTARVFYSKPDPTDAQGRDYDAQGRITAKDLLALDAGPDAQYMLCGPAAFLADIRNGLEDAGVNPAHIHFETFGPAGV